MDRPSKNTGLPPPQGNTASMLGLRSAFRLQNSTFAAKRHVFDPRQEHNLTLRRTPSTPGSTSRISRDKLAGTTLRFYTMINLDTLT